MNHKKETLYSTFQTIYSTIKTIFTNSPQNILFVIRGFLVVFAIRIMLTILDTVFIVDEYPFQRILFVIATALLIMGLEIGYTKFIFNVLDGNKLKISNIFNHFDLLGKYLFTSIMYYLILLIGSLPGLLIVYAKYGFQIIDIINNSLEDPYYFELINSYFNIWDFVLIVSVIIIPIIYLALPSGAISTNIENCSMALFC